MSNSNIILSKSPASYQSNNPNPSLNSGQTLVSGSNYNKRNLDSSNEDSDDKDNEDSTDSSDSEVTLKSRLSSNGNKRKSIFGLSRTPAKVTLSKFDLLTQGMTSTSLAKASKKDEEEPMDESSDDSEYETEEVYELREWYPPDFWRAKDQDNADRVCQTDVTANNLTVTMLESRVCDGFFKAL